MNGDAAQLPSIDVVLPTFDDEGPLPTALASLAAQRYAGRVSVLCVDAAARIGAGRSRPPTEPP